MLAFIAKYLLGIAHLGDYVFVYLCICVFLREVIIRMQHQVIKEQVDQDVVSFTNPLAAVRRGTCLIKMQMRWRKVSQGSKKYKYQIHIFKNTKI